MSLIHLTTFIAAPIDRVFDLSRSIDLHKRSMNAYGELPVGGKTTGLLEEHETVTWKARHLFRERTLKVKMTSVQKPYAFVDEQAEGDFRLMKHEHYFKPVENGTIMIDQFYFDSLYGILGSWLNKIFLRGYMERLLTERNMAIKSAAESNQWKQFIDG